MSESGLIPYTTSFPDDARRVLALAPHPDDEVFGCGGTLALLASRGATVRVVIATDSAWGGAFAPGADPVAVRRAESVAAARLLGYEAPSFWGLPDRGLRFDEVLVARISEALRDFAPDLLLAPAPREIHPDHHALGLAALEAARRHGGALRVWLYEISAPLAPNRLVDIGAVRARKREAMKAFASQLAMRPYHTLVDALNHYRSYTLDGALAAEAFHEIGSMELRAGVRSVIDRISAPAARQSTAAPPLVSVIVRSMDRASLRETLESIARQSYRWIDVVVVDATGRHGPLPSNWGGLPLQQVGQDRPLSRPAAANVGLEAAHGDWLLFVDDDDLLLETHVERLVAAAREGGPQCAYYAGVQVVDADGSQVDVYDYPDAASRLPAHNPFPIHAVLFSRLWVEAGLRFDESLPVYEDWDFWLQLGTRVRYVHVPGISAVYRAALGDSGLGLAADNEAREAGRLKVLQRWSSRMRAEDFERLLQTERSSREQAQAQAARADHRAEDLQRQIEEARRLLESERMQARAQTLALTDSVEAVKRQAKQFAHERDVAVEEARAFASDRDAAVALAQQIAAERDAAVALAQQIAAARDAANVRLQDLYRSHSWRITAPLRAIADWLRALRLGRVSQRAVANQPSAPVATSVAAAIETTSDVAAQRSVGVLLPAALFDAAAVSALLERLPPNVRICVPAPSGRLAGVSDARAFALMLPPQARLDEQLVALRAAVPGTDVVVVGAQGPIPDAATIAALVEPFSRSAAVATVSPAVTGADVFGVAVPSGMASALADGFSLRLPQQLASLTLDWPGPRGAAVALRFEALRDLGAPPDLHAGLARWAEWSRGFGWVHAVAPVRVVGANDEAPASAFLRDAEVAARWARFLAEPAVGAAARELLFEQLLFSSRPPVLVMDHNLGGGANRYRARRISQWLRAGHPVLLFHDDLYHETTVAVLHHPQAGEWRRAGFDAESLLALAARGEWAEIFFNNAAHARDPLAVPALLLRLRQTTGAPLTFAVHDFYSVCPVYVLLNNEARHCGVPDDLADCERCLAANRFDPHRGAFGIRQWRAAWGTAIEAADRVLTFNRSGARLLARAYPTAAARIQTEPHDVPSWPAGTSVPLDFSCGLRIGVVGSLSEAKGSAIVVDLVREVARRGLDVPVVSIGQLTDCQPPAGLTCTGPYRTEQLPRLLAAHRVNCCFFPSICPETFSYVLSELMQLDLPICAFDLGAQGDRVREYPRGVVVSEISAAAALDAMLALVASQVEKSAAS